MSDTETQSLTLCDQGNTVSAIYSKENSTLTLALAEKVIDIIQRDEGISELDVTVPDELVESRIDDMVGSESITIMGIHTFFLVEAPVSEERLHLEFTAICVLADLSTRYLMKHPGLSKEERVTSDESLIVVISFDAFKKYQTLCTGLMFFQQMNNTHTFLRHQIKVRSKRFGLVCFPTSKDKDMLAEQTRWTTDVFKASNLSFRHIKGVKYLDTEKVRMPAKMFFIQKYDEENSSEYDFYFK